MASAMAESSSPALPGDIEWLPGPGGSRVLRIPPRERRATGADPVPARAGRSAASRRRVPGRRPSTRSQASWTGPPPGSLGPTAPEPPSRRPARPRGAREAHRPCRPTLRGEPAVYPGPCRVRRGPVSRPRRAVGRRRPRRPARRRPPLATSLAGTPSVRRCIGVARVALRTSPPLVGEPAGDAEAVWLQRRAELAHELAEAAAAIARARDGERSVRDAAADALSAARADLRASRAAREADASTLAALDGELHAERAAHAVTRGSIGTLADALTTARAELAAAKTRGEATRAELRPSRGARRRGLSSPRSRGARRGAGERRRRARRCAARRLAGPRRDRFAARRTGGRAARERPSLLHRVNDLDRHAVGHAELERRAREQAEAAASATRRPAQESAQLLANLDAAAAALRATVAAPAAEPTPSAEPVDLASAASAAPEPTTAEPTDSDLAPEAPLRRTAERDLRLDRACRARRRVTPSTRTRRAGPGGPVRRRQPARRPAACPGRRDRGLAVLRPHGPRGRDLRRGRQRRFGRGRPARAAAPARRGAVPSHRRPARARRAPGGRSGEARPVPPQGQGHRAAQAGERARGAAQVRALARRGRPCRRPARARVRLPGAAIRDRSRAGRADTASPSRSGSSSSSRRPGTSRPATAGRCRWSSATPTRRPTPP